MFLALLAAQVTAAGHLDLQLAQNLCNAAVTEAAADGGINDAVFRLFASRERLPLVRRYSVPQDVTLNVHVESLAGRLNPNVASPALLRALLEELGVGAQRAASLTDAIRDWSTPGQVPRPHGAKAAEYRADGRIYGPPGAPFRSLDELGLVLGMTPELLDRLRPHLTVWWEADPDAAVADPVVLRALHSLGMDEERASTGQPGAGRVVDITAEAIAPGGSRFVRHAVVTTLAGGSRGQLWRQLEWNSAN